MKRVEWLISGFLVLGFLSGDMSGAQSRPAQGADPLTLLTTINVGGSPSAIVVDSYNERNDVIFYGDNKVRFIDGDTLSLTTDELQLATREWEGWMVYDRYHHQTYVVATRSRETDLRVSWEEAKVHVVRGRDHLGEFSINEIYNTDPQNPEDDWYAIEGLVYKQPYSEGSNPGRLIIDDTQNGNIDVVDLNTTGTAAARLQRYSYREPVPSGWFNIKGNSLALEPLHETLGTDDLTNTDLLYIADLNRKHPDGYYLQGYLRALRLNHPMQDLNATSLPDVDLTATWPFSNGNEGLAMAGPRDVLYVASGLQSFDNGYVAEVDTTKDQIAKVVDLTYHDTGFVHVDWYDPRLVFVATYDGFYNDPNRALYLNLVYDGAMVSRLRLMDNYDEYNGLRGMAFDPQHRRLYLTVASSVMVVEVNFGPQPPPVADAWVYLPLIVR